MEAICLVSELRRMHAHLGLGSEYQTCLLRLQRGVD